MSTSEMPTCPRCGRDVPEAGVLCACGYEFPGLRTCMSCGEPTARDSLICPACGGATTLFVPGLRQAKTAMAAAAVGGGLLVVLADILGWGPDAPGFGGQGWAGVVMCGFGVLVGVIVVCEAVVANAGRGQGLADLPGREEGPEQALDRAIADLLKRLTEKGVRRRARRLPIVALVAALACGIPIVAAWRGGLAGDMSALVLSFALVGVVMLVVGVVLLVRDRRREHDYRTVLDRTANALERAPNLPEDERVEEKRGILESLRGPVADLDREKANYEEKRYWYDPSRDVTPVRHVRNPAATGVLLSVLGILVSAALTAPLATTRGFTALTWSIGLGLSIIAVCSSFWFAHKAAAIGLKRAEWLLGLWLSVGVVLGITVLLIVL